MKGLNILLQEGVISAEDLDKVLPNGLGTRYAFIGAFEVCHLNADGKYPLIIL